MSNIADRVRIAQDKDGMLRRALERIIQLYTDKSHFVYELLQNAEDAEAKDIKFIQHADHLEVLHDGKPFTSANLQGLCDIGKSDKVDNLNQIGEFGVGFKSVFGICDTVLLYSDPSRYTGKIEGDAVPFAEVVNVIPQPKAGGSFATQAYAHFRNPVAVEEIKADAGIDIGSTLIGMHLKKVAVPVRLDNKMIGEAVVVAARTRPKFIGGVRAVYNEELL